MSALLDTHALVWSLAAPERLSQRARDWIEDASTRVFISVASLYEIEYKRDRDRFLYRLPVDMPRVTRAMGFEWLDIDLGDASDAAKLGGPHRDPWDRIIATQAGRRGLKLITTDAVLSKACADWRVGTFW